MNEEAKKVLCCAAQLRQIITDVVEEIRYVDTSGIDPTEGARAKQAVEKVKQLLTNESLFEQIYPLDPGDDENVRDACRRVFGTWITNDVFDRRR